MSIDQDGPRWVHLTPAAWLLMRQNSRCGKWGQRCSLIDVVSLTKFSVSPWTKTFAAPTAYWRCLSFSLCWNGSFDKKNLIVQSSMCTVDTVVIIGKRYWRNSPCRCTDSSGVFIFIAGQLINSLNASFLAKGAVINFSELKTNVSLSSWFIWVGT